MQLLFIGLLFSLCTIFMLKHAKIEHKKWWNNGCRERHLLTSQPQSRQYLDNIKFILRHLKSLAAQKKWKNWISLPSHYRRLFRYRQRKFLHFQFKNEFSSKIVEMSTWAIYIALFQRNVKNNLKFTYRNWKNKNWILDKSGHKTRIKHRSSLQNHEKNSKRIIFELKFSNNIWNLFVSHCWFQLLNKYVFFSFLDLSEFFFLVISFFLPYFV